MTRLFFILLFLLGVVATQAGYEVKLSTAELLAQTDVVVVGSLANVKEWSVDKIDYGEGTIEVSQSLFGVIPATKKLALRWSNRQYTSGRLDFKETGKVEFVWLLWRAQDGSYRARHSGCKMPVEEKKLILAAIRKQKAEQAVSGNGG